MRHAKSDWDATFRSDHERPLDERGVRSAKLMGRLLAGSDLVPDLTVTSTALRARSTAELARDAGEWTSEVVSEASLYGGGTEAALQVAASAPSVGRLMLVGHQPTWSMLVSVLTGERVEMKTATVAVIEFEIEAWREISTARGRVVAELRPRDYFDSQFDLD